MRPPLFPRLCPKLQRLRHMLRGDLVTAGEIRDRSAKFQDAIIAARREVKTIDGRAQKIHRLIAKHAKLADFFAGHLAIGLDFEALKSSALYRARPLDSLADGFGRLGEFIFG